MRTPPGPDAAAGASCRRRWGLRRSAVAAACCLAAAVGLTAAAVLPPAGGAAGHTEEPGQVVTMRDAAGEVVASVPLGGERFALRYRNSLYGTLAEERYVVDDDGGFRVVQIAADQVSVLEEYYAIPGRARPAPDPDPRTWVADPHPGRPAFGQQSIAATALGERTLLVPGQPPVALWRLVGADPFVVLKIEEHL